MRIPTHQIHNVLNAYARRLKKNHDAGRGDGPADEAPEDRINAYSVEAKRRWIINKISTDIIERIARLGPRRQTIKAPDADGSPPFPTKIPASLMPAETIRYNIITPTGEKISAELKVQDSEFLIRQLEEIVRNAKGN